MSRRKKSVKRTILADSRYDSQTVSKFINVLMYQGKKSTAERIFYGAMDLVESRTSQPGVNVFKQALSNRQTIAFGFTVYESFEDDSWWPSGQRTRPASSGAIRALARCWN